MENIDTIETDNFREANKFLGLVEAFDLEAQGLEDNLIKQKESINKELEMIEFESDEGQDELNSSIIQSDELLSDFILVRKALREDIKSTKILLKKLSEDLSNTHSDDISGNVLMSYAELKKGNVTSMKLLMESYGSVAKTQLDVKKLVTEMKMLEQKDDVTDDKTSSVTNIQNNFIGSTADLLDTLKNN